MVKRDVADDEKLANVFFALIPTRTVDTPAVPTEIGELELILPCGSANAVIGVQAKQYSVDLPSVPLTASARLQDNRLSVDLTGAAGAAMLEAREPLFVSVELD